APVLVAVVFGVGLASLATASDVLRLDHPWILRSVAAVGWSMVIALFVLDRREVGPFVLTLSGLLLLFRSGPVSERISHFGARSIT
ncbi:MAG: hypothetical protein ABIP03_11405, partial [Aquihabitans sp.]